MTHPVYSDDIDAFRAVARHLSFTRAAGELFLTPQAVSARISRLERRLGLVLFRRTTRRVRMTPEAVILLTGIESADALLESTLVTITDGS